MGMYDEVSNVFARKVIEDCPFCKENLYTGDECVEWQTKCFENILAIIGLEDIDRDTFEMHTICPHCGKYFSVDVNLGNGTYKVSTRDYESKTETIADLELLDEYKDVKLKSIFTKGTKEWLKSLDIGYNICNGFEGTNYEPILEELASTYYIIPKENFEDLE